MDLVRDCLDKPLFDRHHRPMGRVDGIIVEWEQGRQPRLAHIELGSRTLAQRFGQRIGHLFQSIHKRLLGSVDSYRIPWSKVHVGFNEVKVDVEAERTPALTWELWLRKKIISRIPGGRLGKK
jgi:hypothetical protein